jgi:hypothetical protein
MMTQVVKDTIKSAIKTASAWESTPERGRFAGRTRGNIGCETPTAQSRG